MEGTLFKWTYYYNGWQLRYFVLNETGVLSYYKSSELIHEGCKGSCLKKSKNKLSELTIDEKKKLLNIKSDRKTYLLGFIDDDLDYLLDFCDKDRRKQIMLPEGDGSGNAWYDDQDEDQQWLTNKQKERVELANQAENTDSNTVQQQKRTPVVKFNEQIQTKMIDDDDHSIEDEDDFDEEDFDDEEKKKLQL